MKKVTLLFAVLLSCFFWQANAQCVSSFPWNEGFESTSTTKACWLPNSWNLSATNGYGGITPHTGTSMAEFDGGATSNLVTPVLDLSGVPNPKLEFYFDKASLYGSYGTTYAYKLKVFYKTTLASPYVLLNTWDLYHPGPWTKVEIFLPNPSSTYYIAFQGVSGSLGAGSVTVDDVTIKGVSCIKPSNLSASNITSNSADLDWTPGATETKWDIEYGATGFTPGTGTLVNDDDSVSDESITGLTAATGYDFYVRAECAPADLSAWSGPFSVVTSCVPYNAFTEDFDATAVGSLPVCWDMIDNGTAAAGTTWSVGTPDNGSAFNGTQVAEMPQRNLGFGGSSDDYLISPPLSVVAASSDQFVFYARSDNASNTETINILVSTTGKATTDFTPIQSAISVPGAWTYYKYDLTTYVGQTIYIAIQATTPTAGGFDYNAYGLYVDHAVLRAIPTCLQPSNLTASAITSTTADLGWTDNNTTAPGSWDVELVNISASGTPTGTPTTTGVSNPYQATGLSSSTDYEFYVRANCGGGDLSSWAGPFAFTTLCAPYGAFTENFDALPQDVLPDCWASLINSSDGNTYVKTDNANSLSAPNNLEMYNYSDGNADVIAITPELTDMANGTHQIRFFARGDAGDALEVGTMTDPTNIATYTMVQSFPLTTSYQEFIVRFNTPQTDGYIAFKGDFGGTYNDINIDDVFWETIPTCTKPASLTIISMEDISANLGWTETGTATAWEIEYGTTGFTQGTGTAVADADGTPDEVITGLTASTAYEFYVRADCGGGDLSIWEGPLAFTTLCAPSALPFTETFDDPDTPTCWVESGDTSWDFSTSAGYAASSITDHTSGGGTDYAWMDGSDNTDGETGTLASPLVDVSTLTTPALDFYVFSNNTDDAAINILDVEFYDGTNWNNVLHLTSLLGANWTRYLIDLGSYTITGDVRVRFTVTGNANGGNTYYHDILIDDVSFIEMPTCPTPGALTASSITQTSADLGWTEYGTATTWDIELGTAGFTPTGTPSYPGVTANPYNVSTLSPCESYEFYVRADCGGGDLSNWAGPYQFSTQAGAVSDFSENFDALPTGTIPDCWSSFVATGYSSSVETSSANSHSAPNSLRLYHGFYSVATEMYAVTPELSDLQAGTHQIRFFAAQTGGATLEIGTMSNPTDETTFHLVNTIAVTGTYAEYIVPFRLPQAGHKYVAFKVNTTTTFEGIDIDDVFWEPLPPCKKPENLTASNIQQTTADLGWTDPNIPVATMWDVDIELAGNPQAAPITATGVTSNPYPATGLTAGTEYEFYVRTDCGSGSLSTWSGPFAFTTDCVPSGSFTENFDSYPIGTLPICWGKIVNSTSTFATVEIEDFSSYSAPNQLRMYNYNDVAAELFAVLPEVSDLPNGTHQLRFFVIGGTGMTLEVGTMSDPANESTFTSIQLVPTTGSYQEVIIPFASVGTDTYVAFRATFTATIKSIIIDDVFWEPIPSCPKPSNLNASGVLGNSADLSWTDNAGASKWDLYIVTSGTAAPTGATTPTDNDVTTNPYHKTSLTPQTDYEYYVRAVCGPGDMSVWVGPFAFSTPCATKIAPWTDDVEGHADSENLTTSNCWTATATTSYDWNVEALGYGNSSLTGPSSPHSGVAYFYVEASSPASAGDVAELISPMIDVSGLNTPALEFYYHMYGADMGDLHVDIHDGTAWVTDVAIISGQQQTSATALWNLQRVILSGYTGVIQVRFRAICAGSYRGDISLDDISIVEAPICTAPSNLTITNLTSTTADVSWTAGGTEAEWELEYGPAGFAPGSGTIVIDNDGTLGETLTGLTPNTAYDVYVTAICSSNQSGQVGPVTFTTLVACPDVSNITTSNLSDVAVDITWTAGGSETEWELEYGSSGFAPGSGTIVADNDGTLGETLTGLTPNTAYDVYVTAICSNNQSGQVGPVSFTTLVACPNPSAITAGGVTHNTANIDWTPGGSETEWEVEYGTTGFVPGSGTIVTDNDGTSDEVLTGLMPNTAYDVYVTAICSNNQSGQVGPISFTTLLQPPVNDNLTDAISLVLDATCSGSAYTNVGATIQPNEPIGNCHFSADAAQTTVWFAFVAPSSGAVTVSTDFSGGSLSDTQLTLYEAPTNPNDLSTLGLQVGCDDDSGSGLLSQINVTGLTPGDTYYTQVDGYNGSGGTFCLTVTTDCPPVTGITVSNVNASSANVSWTPGGIETEWEIEYGPTGFALGSGAGIVVNDADATPSETLTGLMDNTVYDVYVTAVCGPGNKGTTTGPKTFTTPPCLPVTNITVGNIMPTTADVSWTPTGTETEWEVEYGTTGFILGNGTIQMITGTPSTTLTNLNASTNYDVYVTAICGPVNQSSVTGPEAFTTPPVNDNLADAISLVLDAACSGSAYTNVGASVESNEPIGSCHFFADAAQATVWFSFVAPSSGTVTVSTDFTGGSLSDTQLTIYEAPTNVNDLSTLGSQVGCDDDSGSVRLSRANVTGLIPGNTYYIQVDGYNSTKGTFCLEVTANCPPVTGITVSSIGADTANIDWTPGGSEAEWDIEYGPSGFSPGSGTIVSDNDGTSDEILTGLMPNTAYDVYVTAVCGAGNQSGQVGPVNFTTQMPPCPDPTAITVGGLTHDTANIDWTPGGSETEWKIEYGPSGFAPGSGTIVSDNDGTSDEILTGLTPNTAYDVYVTAVCGPGNKSGQVGPAIFTTQMPPCLDPTAITVGGLTHDTANIDWMPGGSETEWEIEYGLSGFSPGSGIIISDSDGVSDESLTGLSPNTAYDVYVTAVCGTGNKSGHAGPVSFTTSPQPPVNDDLAGAISLSLGATCTGNAYTNVGATIESNEPIGSCHFSSDVAQATVWFAFVAPPSGAVTVSTDFTGGSLGDTQLTIYEAPTNVNDLSTLGLQVGCDDDSGTNRLSIAVVNGLTPGNTYYVQMDGYNGAEGTFCLEVIADCPPISGVAVSNIDANSANIDWTPGSNETEWEIEYGPSGFSPGSGTVVTDSDGTSDETLTGLVPNTAYDVYVTAVCGTGNQSGQIGPVAFMTLVSCPDVSNITCSNVTNTIIELSWTAGGSETKWEIEYGLTGFTPGSGTIVVDNDGTLGITLTGLTPQTSYDFYVTAICSNNVSGQVGPATCTTLHIADQVFEGFTYYPNPVSSELSLKATNEIEQVVIYDLLGQEVLKVRPNSLTPTLNLNNLQAGTYLMKVDINGSLGVFRIIKE